MATMSLSTATRTALAQAIITAVLALLEPERRARGVSLRFEGQAPAALADPVALQQVLHNLASNALAALEAVPEAAGLWM